jgi:Tol biopolymer transport system component
MTVGVDGKNERRVVTRARPNRISANQFSPDGKSIAFAAGQSATGARDFRLMQVDLARGTEREIASQPFFQIRDLEWLAAGDGLLLTASEVLAGKQQIWHVSSRSGEAKALTKDATNYVSISLNKNADKMVATFQRNTFHLFLAAANDVNSLRMLTPALGFTFMPDGNIVYSGDDGDIWTMNRDGRGQRQLTNSSYFDFAPAVSADGRYIFFTSNRSGSNQVWRMNADGSNQIQLTSIEGGYPRFVTPDGKWVYFESGLHQTLWRVTSDGHDESQVAEGRLYSPAFSPDGKLAAYIFRAKEGDTRIGVLSLDDRKVLNTFSVADKPIKIAWATDNQSISYVTTNGATASLWRRSLTEQKPQLIAELGDDEIGEFAISPDGGTFGFVRGKWVHDAVLIEGLK